MSEKFESLGMKPIKTGKMETNMNHKQTLIAAGKILNDRAQEYGGEEACFKRISDLATIVLNKPISEYDVAMILHCVLAARAHGLAAMDGPYGEIANVDGFAAECAQARDMGFDGKTLIHPNQIGPVNEIFAPSAEEVAFARRIIATVKFDMPIWAARPRSCACCKRRRGSSIAPSAGGQ